MFMVCSSFARNQWVLFIFQPEAQVVYHLDPLKRRIESVESMQVVNK